MKGKTGGGQIPLTDCSLLGDEEQVMDAGTWLLRYGASTGSWVSVQHNALLLAVLYW